MPASDVHRRVRAALQPFIKYRNQWTFHYPVYLNTFCFTYDLASLVAEGSNKKSDPDPLSGCFRRHDWWRGLPDFTYRRDIEIFVAVPRMIDQARNEGHNIRSEHYVRFTRYDIKRVFVRKRTAQKPPRRRWLLVTDLKHNAEELIRAWDAAPPRWLNKMGGVKLKSDDIRESWRRELHDLFADDHKIYLVSAPMAWVLKEQPDKYVEKRAGIRPIDTFFVFRCNSGVDPAKIRELRRAVASYYKLIFGTRQATPYLHPDVARQYGRIASTIGQPHPFPEIHALRDSQASRRHSRRVPRISNSKLITRYAEILRDHHRP